MSRGGIDVEGLPGLKAALARAAEQVTEGAERAVREEVDAIHDDAVKFAPRDKGDLERGIRAETSGLQGTVRSTARHSGFVENGTFKDEAQPFMAPAATRSRRRLPERAAAIIKAALGGR